MFDRIEYLCDSHIIVTLKQEYLGSNLMNMIVVILEKDRAIFGEIQELNYKQAKILLLCELNNGKLISGILRKPSMNAQIRLLAREELQLLLGEQQKGTLYIGDSAYYDSKVFVDLNILLGHHFAIFGNSGSGKSCGLARIIQNIFNNQMAYPYKANFILFDISGEYSTAFSNLNSINPNYNYRLFTTNKANSTSEKFKLPICLLEPSDIALLLMCNTHTQILIIEKMLKLTKIFAENSDETIRIKNHLIAKAIISILYSNQTAVDKRNDIFSIINTCQTPQFNLESSVQGIGYTRKFRECFLIDKSGEFTESILVTEYVSKFINDEYDKYEPAGNCFYTLTDMEKALEFALISEGLYKNENSYTDSITVKVRLHSLMTGKYGKIFECQNYITREQYLSNLIISNNKRYQLININLDDVDDNMARVITKILTKLIFDFCKNLSVKGSVPFHILIDEAHRYIKKDDIDQFLIGYNIFERVAKEGRKYGVIMGIISQRPVELSETVISQISNFLIFKTNHPMDVEYLKKMVPNINSDIIDKQKFLPSGVCLSFGSAFRIPLIIKLDKPDPMINAEDCMIIERWEK